MRQKKIIKLYNFIKQCPLPVTTPTLSCVTYPHLYLGVVILDLTLTLSPILIVEGEGKDCGKPSSSTCINRTQYVLTLCCQLT